MMQYFVSFKLVSFVLHTQGTTAILQMSFFIATTKLRKFTNAELSESVLHWFLLQTQQ